MGGSLMCSRTKTGSKTVSHASEGRFADRESWPRFNQLVSGSGAGWLAFAAGGVRCDHEPPPLNAAR